MARDRTFLKGWGGEAGSFANVVEGAKAAVISVRARHAVDVGGALVVEPLSNGPARKAGIAAGDVIDSINGEAVRDDHDLSRKMIGLAPGISVNLSVRHDGMEKTVAVTLGEVPAAKGEFAASPVHATEPAAAPPPLDLGLKLAPETSGAENRGVIVIGMGPNGRAADLGIEAGDIILELGGRAVQTLDDIRNALNDARLAGRHGVLMWLKSGHRMRFVAVPVDPVEGSPCLQVTPCGKIGAWSCKPDADSGVLSADVEAGAVGMQRGAHSRSQPALVASSGLTVPLIHRRAPRCRVI